MEGYLRNPKTPILVTCPHCKTDLAATPELFGQTVQCPACKGKLEVPSAETKSETTSARTRPQRSGWDERDHANVDFIKSLGIGAVLTACFLALLIPFADTGIGSIFLKRGWVNFAETFLFTWGMTILVMKWKQNKRQERAAMLELFPARLGDEINCDNVGGFIDNIYKIPLTMRDSLIVNRIRKSLELSEAGETMNQRLATHQETVEKSFQDAVAKLSDIGTEVFIRSHVELTKTFEKMANGIDLLNNALRDIGANQIPDTAKKKRGLFGR